jgi:hypothetical protein
VLNPVLVGAYRRGFPVATPQTIPRRDSRCLATAGSCAEANIPLTACGLSSLAADKRQRPGLSPSVRRLRGGLSELCAVFATVRIFLNRTAIPHWFLLQCRLITTTGGFMNVQATYYRRRAIVARQSAAAAMDPSVRAAFAEVACHWLGLAEHTEWLQSMQRESIRSGGSGERGTVVAVLRSR